MGPAKTHALHTAIAAVCPILGVSVGRRDDPTTVSISFDPTATAEQRTAGTAVLAAFDWSDAAQLAREEAGRPGRRDLRAEAAQALADNAAFLAVGSPSPAQMLAQLRRLTVYNTLLIRRLLED